MQLELEVRCPNMCFDGMIKHYQDDKALYTFIKCPFCRGTGEVKESEVKRINKKI